VQGDGERGQLWGKFLKTYDPKGQAIVLQSRKAAKPHGLKKNKRERKA